MHDPMTVAFNIPRPWPDFRARTRKLFGRLYWPSIATIWHVDPETDGSDNSCAWGFVRLTEAELEWAKLRAEHEWKMRFAHDCQFGSASNRDVLTSVWCEIAFSRPGMRRRRGFIYRTLPRRDRDCIDHLLISTVEGCHGTIDRARESVEGMRKLIQMVIRLQRTMARPWYRHPRWHIHHWKLQVQPLMNLKRFLFSRCAGCGKHFAYGYSPSTANWHGTGPLWFKSEEGIYHAECMGATAVSSGGAKEGVN